jgi:psiF repeat
MRIATLVCACAISLIASEVVLVCEAAAQNATAGMGGGPSSGINPNSAPPRVPDHDPGARSARSIECAQKADAQGLEGKARKRFLHECRSGE